ncbi:MAG: CbiQ family ECF transporter T component [Nitrospinaceae bacterium]
MKNNFLSSILGGGYCPGNSPLHKMAPDHKILLVLIFLCVSALGGWSGLVLTGAVCFAGLALSGCSVGEVARYSRGIFWFVLILALFPVLFTPDVGTANSEGVYAGLLAASRVTVMFFLSIIMLRTTAPMALAGVIESFFSRMPWAPAWVREGATVGLLALQLLPAVCLQAEARVASKLEAERESLKKSGLLARVRNAAHLLVPWTVTLLSDPRGFAKHLEESPDEFPSK